MKWARWAFAILTLGVVIYLFWPLLGEIKKVDDVFRSITWGWILVAIIFQFITYSFLTWLNLLTLTPFPGKISFWHMMAALSSIAYIEVAVPSFGVSGLAMRIRLLGKHGYNPEAATFTELLESVYLFMVEVVACTLGFVYLLQGGNLGTPQLLTMVFFALLISLFLWYAWLILTNPKRGPRAWGKMVGWWNIFFGRNKSGKLYLAPDVAQERLAQFQVQLTELKGVSTWKFFLAATGRVGFDIATIFACFMAFRTALPPGILLIGYGMTILISGLASLPAGPGLTEASVPIFFNRFGIAGAVAIAAGITYRLIAFWLWRFIGFFNWQILESKLSAGAKSSLPD